MLFGLQQWETECMNYYCDLLVYCILAVIGEGFDQIDTQKLRDNKVLYTLTRHGLNKGNCSVENYCLSRKYMGKQLLIQSKSP